MAKMMRRMLVGSRIACSLAESTSGVDDGEEEEEDEEEEEEEEEEEAL